MRTIPATTPSFVAAPPTRPILVPPLPSVLDHLEEWQKPIAVFLKPKPKTLHDTGPLKTNRLVVREFTLKYNEVVPFHVHEDENDKFYVYFGPGTLTVLVCVSGTVSRFLLGDCETLSIPAGYPHALMYFNAGTSCRVLVINSLPGASPVRWEDSADKLCEKEYNPTP